MADREVLRTRVHRQHHTHLGRESSRTCQVGIIQFCRCLTRNASHAPQGGAA
jgi:hypothetical protein